MQAASTERGIRLAYLWFLLSAAKKNLDWMPSTRQRHNPV